MFDSLPLGSLVAIFASAAAVVWVAGVRLSNMTDVLDHRLGIGSAVGGLVLLSIATDLPEVAITVSGALGGNLDLVTGNLLGGVAIQTTVLVLIDLFGTRGGEPLSYRAASLELVLEGVVLTAILGVVIAGSQLPAELDLGGIDPAALLVGGIWLGGIVLVGRARRGLPWHESGNAPSAQTKRRGHSRALRAEAAARRGISTPKAAAIFTAAALATLAGGVLLEESGSAAAEHLGMSGVLFGATVLAAATALPEVSTGLASARHGDFKLAVSDIFGGNAFLPVLFLLASLLAGRSILPHAGPPDIYLSGVAILLTMTFVCGLVFRPRRRIAGVGVDSFAVLVFYAAGVAGLVAIATS